MSNPRPFRRPHLGPRIHVALAALLLLGFIGWGPRGVAAPTLLVTADGEGHVGPCGSCPGVTSGGLSRRATLLRQLRADAKAGVILVDAGNWLVGEQSAGSRGEAIIEAYGELGYDAVNFTTKDLYWGKDDTLALLKRGKFAAVSANLLDERSGEPLVSPYVVKTVGAERVAILGLSEPPAGLGTLPHVQRQLAGVRVRAVGEALDEWLPKATADSTRVVVLYQGNGAGLRSVRQRLAGSRVVLAVSGVRPENVANGAPPVVAAAQHGRAVGRGEFGEAAKVDVTNIEVLPSIEADAGMTALLARYQPPVPAPGPLATAPPEAPPGPGQAISMAPPAAPVAVANVRQVIPAPVTQAVTTVPPAKAAPLPAGAIPRVAARQARTPLGLMGVGLTSDAVNGSIDKGREFLSRYVKAQHEKHSGTRLVEDGPDLLAMLALVHAGEAAKNPEFEARVRQYLAEADPRANQLGTYEAGLFCLLVEAYGDPVFLSKLRDTAQYLLELQGEGGTWGYGKTIPPSAFRSGEAAGGALSVFGGTPLDGPTPGVTRLARVTEYKKELDGDNSVSQFALLGLRSAARFQINAPADAWQRNLASYRKRQCEDGGWDYEKASAAGYGSMTCAGICAVAVNRHALGERDPAVDPAVERGLAWLEKNFAVDTNPAHGKNYVYYYLYSLERVGRILDTEFIGKHEWYPLGARFLVGEQKPDGRWVEAQEEEDPRLATSFALLFLTRATETLNPEVVRNGSGELRTSLASVRPSKLYVILDASGSMLEEMGGRMKFDLAREAVRAMASLLQPKSQLALRVYGHRKRATDPGAQEDTELLVPMAEYDGHKFQAMLAALRSRGKTPLALSLEQAAGDLRSASAPDPVTVVLLTDGGEDTVPRRDPVAAAAQFGTLKGVTLHIVGFDVNQEDWNKQLRDMADAAHGQYWPAPRGDDLMRSLKALLLGDPDGFVVQDAAGHEAYRGHFGERTRLNEGKYTLVTQFAGREFRQDFWINTRQQTSVTFDAARAAADPAGRVATKAEPAKTPAAGVKFCTNCGAKLAPGAKFCTECGKPVARNP